MRFLFAILSLILSTSFSNAQNQTVNEPANNQIVSGSFSLAKGQENLSIVYVVNPQKEGYLLELSTANPLPLSASLIDAQGQTVAEWQPAETSHLYHHLFQVRKSADMPYTIQVKHNGRLIQTISTTKN